MKSPVGHADIVTVYSELMNHYATRAKNDEDLARNVATLSQLINTYATDVNLLTQISLYRQTYTPRDPSTPSGWFYRDLVNELAALTTRIGTQERVLKRLARVGIITDYRTTVAGSWYNPPHPSGPETETGD